MRLKSVFTGLLLAFAATIFVGCEEKKVDLKQDFDVRDMKYENASQICTMASYDGKLWVGSRNGLHCYDGKTWQVFTPEKTNQLASKRIEQLQVADERLWIANYRGSCVYDGKQFISLLGGRIKSCAGEGNNVYHAVTEGVSINSQVYLHDPADTNYTNSLCYNDTTVVYPSPKGLIVGTKLGLSIYSVGAFTTYRGPDVEINGASLIPKAPIPTECNFPGNFIKCVLPVSNGLYAVGTTCGMVITDFDRNWVSYRGNDTFNFVQRGGNIEKEMQPGNADLPGSKIRAFAKTPGGELIFVGTNRGLAVIKDGKCVDAKKIYKRFSTFYNITALAYLNDTLYVADSYKIWAVTGFANYAAPKAAEEK